LAALLLLLSGWRSVHRAGSPWQRRPITTWVINKVILETFSETVNRPQNTTTEDGPPSISCLPWNAEAPRRGLSGLWTS